MTSILQQAAARKASIPPSIIETAPPGESSVDVVEVPKEAPVGGYTALKIKRLILTTGVIVHPVDGYFIPSSQEEYDMLEYFASKGLIVAPSEDKKI